MTIERLLNKASAGMSILRGQVFTWAYGIDAARGGGFGGSCVVRGGHPMRIGSGVNITDQTWLNVEPTGHITIEDRCGLGRRTLISAAASICIGDDTVFDPNV